MSVPQQSAEFAKTWAGRNEDYKFDAEGIEAQKQAAPWAKDPLYFKKCRVTALATMKMLKHALAGVHKGEAQGSKPIEIMGLLIGKSTGSTVVVTDAYPLPVEGTESRVIADDDGVMNYMINLSESLEGTRNERFIGWYHSHPFDVGQHSHCFLSTTDVQTQLNWQRVLDARWVVDPLPLPSALTLYPTSSSLPPPLPQGIVVDPLRSLAKQEPTFAAFRAYPPDYSPPANTCPDMEVHADKAFRQERWGHGSDRYYQLHVDYALSGLGAHLLDVMARKSLWMRVLSSAPALDAAARMQLGERAQRLSARLSLAPPNRQRALPSFTEDAPVDLVQLDTVTLREASGLQQHADVAADMAIEQCQAHASQTLKHIVFDSSHETTAHTAADTRSDE
ncbi:MAG: hypothetical protein MHM6MM_008016 [Cercozoa sp. M6MM]